MIDGYIIDANGYMLSPKVNLPDGTQDGAVIDGQTIVVTRCPDGMFKPQWNGTAWVDANAPTPAQQLASAQQAKIAEITAGLNATLARGFTSKTTGHTYVTKDNGQSNMEGDMLRFTHDSSLTSVNFYTTDAGWVAHTQAQLQGAFLDGGKWKDAQYAQAQTLTQQVRSATTIDDANAVASFTEASY